MPTNLARGTAPGPLRIREDHPVHGPQIMEFSPVIIHELQRPIVSTPVVEVIAGISYWVTLRNKPVQEKTKKWAAFDKNGRVYRVIDPGIFTASGRIGVVLESLEPIGYMADPGFFEQERLDLEQLNPDELKEHLEAEPRGYVVPPLELFQGR